MFAQYMFILLYIELIMSCDSCTELA